MYNLKLKNLVLPVVALASIVAIACASGDGSEAIVGPRTAAATQPSATSVEIAAVPSSEVGAAPTAEAPAGVAVAESPSATEATEPAAADEPVVTVVESPIGSVVTEITAVDQVFDTLTPQQIVAAEEEVIAGIYENVVDSTVQIIVGAGTGSGFVWDTEGRIVTNFHVVADALAAGGPDVRVLFPDGTDVAAEVLGTDPDSDLAVIDVTLPADYLKPITLGDSDVLRPGQLALAIGAPFGRDFTLTRGVISALGRRIDSPRGGYSIPDAIQTDASINPGNSGGPLLDRLGRVIGINSQIESEQGVNTGIGFAVPINQAKRVIPVLIGDGVYRYSWLGVQVGTLTAAGAEQLGLPSNTRGAILDSFVQNGPAARSELQPGDIVTAIDGTTVTTFEELISYLAARTRPGDAVTLELLRGGDSIEVDVTLGTRPSSG